MDDSDRAKSPCTGLVPGDLSVMKYGSPFGCYLSHMLTCCYKIKDAFFWYWFFGGSQLNHTPLDEVTDLFDKRWNCFKSWCEHHYQGQKRDIEVGQQIALHDYGRASQR